MNPATSKLAAALDGERHRPKHAGSPLSAAALLSLQPKILLGLTPEQRNAIVISAVDDKQGRALVVSRFGDAAWNLSSEWTLKSARGHERRIKWPADLPQELIDDLKAVAYAWLRRGRPNIAPAAAPSIRGHVTNSMPLMRHLMQAGVRRLEDVQPLTVWDFVKTYGSKVVPSYLTSSLELLNAAWIFREELLHPLRKHPFSGKPLGLVAGVDPRLVHQKAALTSVIPPSVNELLFEHVLAVIAEAPKLLAQRDKGLLIPTARKLLPFRDAALYLTEITTGMRNSEALGITPGCWRTEERNGVVFHWIRTIDVKTRAGPVDYLMPPELVPVLELLERYARPLQEQLEREIAVLSRALQGGRMSKAEAKWVAGAGPAGAVERLADAQASVGLLFLGQAGRNRTITGECQVDVMNGSGSSDALMRIARAAGTKWPLNNMQCRRTFGWMAAHSALGVHGTIFVRWQFHHKELSLSHLYGANPRQDTKLYGELEAEFQDAVSEVLENWFLPDESLSGGAGKRIMRARATPARDLKSLLRASAESITIRSTGHSWCMSENGSCVGHGIYESYRCGTCSEGVIDGHFSGTWQRIHLVNLGLSRLSSCGPGVEQHVQRALTASRNVLRDLGIAEPKPSDYPSYA